MKTNLYVKKPIYYNPLGTTGLGSKNWPTVTSLGNKPFDKFDGQLDDGLFITDTQPTDKNDPREAEVLKPAVQATTPDKLQAFEIQKLIDDHNEKAVEYTSLLSTILRQIAFTEGSLFWFMKTQLEVNLMPVLFGFAALLLFFSCDALQYYNGYKKYEKEARKFERYMLKNIVNESSYQDSEGLNQAITLPFKFKMFFLVLASVILVLGFVSGVPHL
jgi:hypothetical protein